MARGRGGEARGLRKVGRGRAFQGETYLGRPSYLRTYT